MKRECECECTDVLCGCGWGLLGIATCEVPETCPTCGYGFWTNCGNPPPCFSLKVQRVRRRRRDRRVVQSAGRSALTAPEVHLGGTDGNTLLDQINDARAAVRGAIKAHAATAPHGRDYPKGEYQDSRTSHYARQGKLIDALSELDWIAEAIADQL